CTAAVLLVRAVVPHLAGGRESPLDPVGALLSIVALVPLLYAIIQAPGQGWGDTQVLASFGVAVVFVTLFALWERRCDEPMLDVRFSRDPRFSAASAPVTITFFALYAST